jgi:hypothetical protein
MVATRVFSRNTPRSEGKYSLKSPIRKFLHIVVTGRISRENVERLYKLNPDTAATEYELFRKMNESDDFKRAMLTASSPLCQYAVPLMMLMLVTLSNIGRKI